MMKFALWIERRSKRLAYYLWLCQLVSWKITMDWFGCTRYKLDCSFDTLRMKRGRSNRSVLAMLSINVWSGKWRVTHGSETGWCVKLMNFHQLFASKFIWGILLIFSHVSLWRNLIIFFVASSLTKPTFDISIHYKKVSGNKQSVIIDIRKCNVFLYCMIVVWYFVHFWINFLIVNEDNDVF